VTKVKSASLVGDARSRPLVRAMVEVAGVRFGMPVSVNDRSEMRYPVLIGMDILRSGRFLIDPTKMIPARYGAGRVKAKKARERQKSELESE